MSRNLKLEEKLGGRCFKFSIAWIWIAAGVGGLKRNHADMAGKFCELVIM
jgi:hypothetical protein